MSAEKKRKRPKNREIIRVLELAELWLVNCVPVCSIPGDTPLPKIREMIGRLREATDVKS